MENITAGIYKRKKFRRRNQQFFINHRIKIVEGYIQTDKHLKISMSKIVNTTNICLC